MPRRWATQRGGLLVPIDRRSRRYIIELMKDDIIMALKRLIGRKTLGRVLSITTDSECESLDSRRSKAIVGCGVHYTCTYASWGKVPIGNCNRFVRRWYPKRTAFSTCTGSSTSSTQSAANSSTDLRSINTIPPTPGRHKGDNANENVRTAAETARSHLRKIVPLGLLSTHRILRITRDKTIIRNTPASHAFAIQTTVSGNSPEATVGQRTSGAKVHAPEANEFPHQESAEPAVVEA